MFSSFPVISWEELSLCRAAVAQQLKRWHRNREDLGWILSFSYSDRHFLWFPRSHQANSGIEHCISPRPTPFPHLSYYIPIPAFAKDTLRPYIKSRVKSNVFWYERKSCLGATSFPLRDVPCTRFKWYITWRYFENTLLTIRKLDWDI